MELIISLSIAAGKPGCGERTDKSAQDHSWKDLFFFVVPAKLADI
jgi:hypothetical protein